MLGEVDGDTDSDVDDDDHNPDGRRQRPYYEQETVVGDVRCRIRPTVKDSVRVRIGGTRMSQHNADAGRFDRHAEVNHIA